MPGVRGASRGSPEPLPPRSTRRASRLGIVLLGLSAVFFGVNFSQEWLVSRQVEQSAAALQAQINAQTALNSRLQNAIGYYGSKDYIVTAARELGMARPGDTLMLVKSQPPTIRTVYVRVQPPAPHESFLTHLLRAIFK